MRVIALSLRRFRTLPDLRLGGLAALVVGTLMLAGAIHIAAILLVPSFAKTDGWSRLLPYAGEDRFTEIPLVGEDDKRVAGLDPLFVTGACRVQLAEAPAGITVDARDRFWSVALYDQRGNIVFSVNDRTAVNGKLDMIVLNAAQNAILTKTPTDDLDDTIVTESPSDSLIALLRLFAPTRTAQDDARRVMAQAECLPAPSILQN